MLKRGETAKFMPNSMVFPGGVVDKSDVKLGDKFRIAAIRVSFLHISNVRFDSRNFSKNLECF